MGDKINAGQTFGTRIVYGLAGIVVLAVALPLLVLPIWAAAALVVPAFAWLKTGVWPSKSFWEGIAGFFGERPAWDWVIPNQVLQFTFDAPLWLALIFVWIAYFAAFSFFSGKWDSFRKDHPALRKELASAWLSLSLRAKLLWIGFFLYCLIGWLVGYLLTGKADDAIIYPVFPLVITLQLFGLSLLIWRGLRKVGRGLVSLVRK